MPLQTLVKVSNVTQLTEARYAAGMGVAMVGFPLDPTTPNYLSPKRFQDLTQWIAGVALVGELGSIERSVLDTTLEAYALDYVQLDEAAALTLLPYCRTPILVRIQLRGDESWSMLHTRLAAYQDKVHYFLMEAVPGYEEEVNALQVTINELAQHFPILHGGHLTFSMLPGLLETGLKGIALQGAPNEQIFEQLVATLEFLEKDQEI